MVCFPIVLFLLLRTSFMILRTANLLLILNAYLVESQASLFKEIIVLNIHFLKYIPN